MRSNSISFTLPTIFSMCRSQNISFLMASTMPITCFRVVCRLLVQNASAVYFSVALFLLQCIFADEAHLLFVFLILVMLDISPEGCCHPGLDESDCHLQIILSLMNLLFLVCLWCRSETVSCNWCTPWRTVTRVKRVPSSLTIRFLFSMKEWIHPFALELILKCLSLCNRRRMYKTWNKNKNRESIRDSTAELQVKIIWSCFINK